MSRLKRLAEQNLESGVAGWKRWWTQKYNLPTNHELFQTSTMAELHLEYFEDLVVRRREILDQLDDEDEQIETKERDAMYEVLNRINRALGYEEESQDDLINQWERDLAEGRIPDLDAG